MDQSSSHYGITSHVVNEYSCQPTACRGDHSGLEEQQPSLLCRRPKSYDYTLKFLLVGDSDVGKEEILSGLSDEDDDADTQMDAVFAASSPAVNYKSTLILLDGKRIRLQLWWVFLNHAFL